MNRFSIMALGGAALALAGCTEPLGQNGQMTREQQGALTGAAIGGLIGGIAGDDHKLDKAVIGAAAGALVGAAVGSDLDRQAAALTTAIGNSDVTVVNTGDSLVVTMPQDITFATDSAQVRSDLQVSLANAAATLNQYSNSTIQVIGHTDNTGSSAYNQSLSLERANAVAAVLMANGVSSGRISTAGRGEDAPVASNLTAAGRAQNRRVEIIIIPTG